MLVKALEFLVGLVMGAFGLMMLILISLSDRIQKRKSVPAPEASAGPSAPLDNHGCYVEDDHTRKLREAYVNRRKDYRSKRAIRDLIQNVGRN